MNARAGQTWYSGTDHPAISSVGPSFSNNFNNRAEEALGNADDIWTAYREGAFGDQPAPWIGYLFLLEDDAKSRSPVRVYEPLYKVFPEFRDTSYMQRYELLLRRMVRERRYSAATLITSKNPHGTGRSGWKNPASDLSATGFLQSMLAHLSGI